MTGPAMYGVRLEPYDQGYRDGWHDIHVSTRRRRGKRRRNSSNHKNPAIRGEYTLGYEHGRVDGAGHPDCPDWDDAHRTGSPSGFPPDCPWNPRRATVSRDRSPLSPTVMGAETVDVTASAIRPRAAALQVKRASGASVAETARRTAMVTHHASRVGEVSS